MTKTRVIPFPIRKEVMVRDGRRCQRCGRLEPLGIHHIIPWDQGGGTTPNNLIVLCHSCHDMVEESAGIYSTRDLVVNYAEDEEVPPARRRADAADPEELTQMQKWKMPYRHTSEDIRRVIKRADSIDGEYVYTGGDPLMWTLLNSDTLRSQIAEGGRSDLLERFPRVKRERFPEWLVE